jgi:hypothetical protein
MLNAALAESLRFPGRNELILRLNLTKAHFSLRPDCVTRGDGSCQFLAIADQQRIVLERRLCAEPFMTRAHELRLAAVQYLNNHPQYLPFIALAHHLHVRIRLFSSQTEEAIMLGPAHADTIFSIAHIYEQHYRSVISDEQLDELSPITLETTDTNNNNTGSQPDQQDDGDAIDDY